MVLFPSQPFEPRSVDSAFYAERQAARQAGLETHLFDAEALDAGAFDEAARRLPDVDEDQDAISPGSAR